VCTSIELASGIVEICRDNELLVLEDGVSEERTSRYQTYPSDVLLEIVPRPTVIAGDASIIIVVV
jgi:hypothetical protein